MATAVQHHGKEMSYNNYLDADAAYSAGVLGVLASAVCWVYCTARCAAWDNVFSPYHELPSSKRHLFCLQTLQPATLRSPPA